MIRTHKHSAHRRQDRVSAHKRPLCVARLQEQQTPMTCYDSEPFCRRSTRTDVIDVRMSCTRYRPYPNNIYIYVYSIIQTRREEYAG